MRKILSVLTAFVIGICASTESHAAAGFSFPTFYATVKKANADIRRVAGEIAQTSAEKRRETILSYAIGFSKEYQEMLKQLPEFAKHLEKNRKQASANDASIKYRFIDHELGRLNEEYYRVQADREFAKGGKLDLYKYLLSLVAMIENAGKFSKEHAKLTYHGVMGIVFTVHDLYKKFEDVSGRDPKLEKRINTATVKFLRRAV
jgi:hypothetical protein